MRSLAVRECLYRRTQRQRRLLGCILTVTMNETRTQSTACEYVCMNNQNDIIDNLIETLKDGQEGFKQAAEAVKDTQLKSLFEEYSLQRSRFAGELQNEAIGMG